MLFIFVEVLLIVGNRMWLLLVKYFSLVAILY